MQTITTFHHVELTSAERLRLSELNERMPQYFRTLISLKWDIRESARCSEH